MKMILRTLTSSAYTYICLNLLQIEFTSYFMKKKNFKSYTCSATIQNLEIDLRIFFTEDEKLEKT